MDNENPIEVLAESVDELTEFLKVYRDDSAKNKEELFKKVQSLESALAAEKRKVEKLEHAKKAAKEIEDLQETIYEITRQRDEFKSLLERSIDSHKTTVSNSYANS